MSKIKISDWIKVKDDEVYCERCKEREKIPFPLPMTALVKWAEYFGEKHKFC